MSRYKRRDDASHFDTEQERDDRGRFTAKPKRKREAMPTTSEPVTVESLAKLLSEGKPLTAESMEKDVIKAGESIARMLDEARKSGKL